MLSQVTNVVSAQFGLVKQTQDSAHLVHFAGISVVLTAFALPLSTFAMNTFLYLTVLLIMLSSELRQQLKLVTYNPVATFALGLFLLLMLSSFYSEASLEQSCRVLGKYDNLVMVSLLMPVFCYEQYRTLALQAFVASSSIHLFFIYLKVFGVIDWGGMDFHESAVFKNYLQTSFIMTIATFFLAHMMWQKRQLRLVTPIVLLPFVIYILFISPGRTGYVVFAALTALFCWQRGGLKGLLNSLLLLLLLSSIAYFASENFRFRVTEAFDDVVRYQPGEVSTPVGQRLEFYKNTISMIEQNTLVGSGVGSYPILYARIKPMPSLLTENPHNEYLLFGVHLGLLGIAGLISLFSMQWWFSAYISPGWRYMAQGVIVTIAVGSLFNSWIFDSTQGNFFALFSALCFSPLLFKVSHEKV